MIASNRCKQSEEKAESLQVLSAVSLASVSSLGNKVPRGQYCHHSVMVKVSIFSSPSLIRLVDMESSYSMISYQKLLNHIEPI